MKVSALRKQSGGLFLGAKGETGTVASATVVESAGRCAVRIPCSEPIYRSDTKKVSLLFYSFFILFVCKHIISKKSVNQKINKYCIDITKMSYYTYFRHI